MNRPKYSISAYIRQNLFEYDLQFFSLLKDRKYLLCTAINLDALKNLYKFMYFIKMQM